MKEKIVRHSKDDVKKLKGKTSFKKVSETSDKEIEEQVKRDPDLVLPNEKELEEFKPAKKGKINGKK
jgi:fructose-1-phosphate kinase PfkB-like protein